MTDPSTPVPPPARPSRAPGASARTPDPAGAGEAGAGRRPSPRRGAAATAEVLREEAARFRASFERAPIGLAHVALTGQFLAVNRRLREALGYDEAELLGRHF